MSTIAEKIFDLLTPRGKNWRVPTLIPPAKPNTYDRESPRRPVPRARQSCELRIGGSVVPALLENESAGGFAVTIDPLDGLEAGKMIEFHEEEGWLPVQVVHVEEIAKPLGANGKREVRLRLGLKR